MTEWNELVTSNDSNEQWTMHNNEWLMIHWLIVQVNSPLAVQFINTYYKCGTTFARLKP